MRPVVVSKSSLCPKVEKLVNGVWWKGVSGVAGVLKCFRRAAGAGGRALGALRPETGVSAIR